MNEETQSDAGGSRRGQKSRSEAAEENMTGVKQRFNKPWGQRGQGPEVKGHTCRRFSSFLSEVTSIKKHKNIKIKQVGVDTVTSCDTHTHTHKHTQTQNKMMTEGDFVFF